VSELLRVERDVPRAGSWRFVLDDPSRANALSPRLVASLQASLHAAFENDARAIVLDSSGERFCAGSDLADIDRLDDVELRERFGAIEDLLETLRRAPALTIAVVRGAALGAGADLVASCDYRIGTSGARLAFPGCRFGVVLGTRHLAAVVGRQLAREILVEGRMLDARTAADCGLLSSLCSEDQVAQRVDDILRGSEALDIATLRAILALTRDVPSERDRSELLRSVWRDGLAERMRDHARRARDARTARRVNNR
jgi:enoyl-CoA hydratase/carnithine racemase